MLKFPDTVIDSEAPIQLTILVGTFGLAAHNLLLKRHDTLPGIIPGSALQNMSKLITPKRFRVVTQYYTKKTPSVNPVNMMIRSPQQPCRLNQSYYYRKHTI
jgi:hypothetical protein